MCHLFPNGDVEETVYIRGDVTGCKSFSILFAFSVCSEETATTNLESQEEYDDLFESREDLQNQRNINSNEYRYLRAKGLSDMTPAIFPILEREFLEERGLKPGANLPLRFGRASDDKAGKSVPNLPLRFGRYIPGKASMQSTTNLPQRFGRSQYGGHFLQSFATLPLRFGRMTNFQRLQYDKNTHLPEVKNLDENNERSQTMMYDYERNLHM
ncbi:pro-FMRFamide-related neuropeptide VF [Bufo gargarizans]|uniref:pro-FMRFamide-related neuropeptide VF n=1 Tax=Bufo gargarizans TaxID=30331 RepID=UPI001CF12EE5|nr:pro-FMRFamide-related neuropeptide VF [Bufo gargarizans]